MSTTKAVVSSFAFASLLVAACGPATEEIPDLTGGVGGGAGMGAGALGGTGGASPAGGTGGASATGGTAGTGGAGGTAGTGGTAGAGGATGGAAGGPPVTGGVSGSAGAGGGSGGLPTGGTAGTGGDPTGGTGGTGGDPMGGTGGTGGDPMGGTGGGGMAGSGGGSAGAGPFTPRTGSFKVLAYFNTQGGFTHTQAINTGRTMLMAMGTKQGFEVTFSDNPADFSAANLANYELVFGLNPTGTSLESRATERAAFEEWMTTKNGAFAGVHSSTDFMANWAFWKEVTGQYYDLHDTCCSQQNIQWEAAAANFIAVDGLPSPWQRSEEWYKFKTWATWSAKPGFKVLSKVTTNTDGGTRPVSYIREWSTFRSFYTSLGHEGPTYQDANFIKHVAAGIMWAVRREALFKP
jgi:type 1 glutamine amidotransferase